MNSNTTSPTDVQTVKARIFSNVNYSNILNSKWTKLVLFVGLTASIRKLYNDIHRKYKKFPPGPVGYPFFGCLFSCIDIPKYAAYLASNYGPITMVYIGSQPFVFLHSIKYINEINKNKNALDRDEYKSLGFAHLQPSELSTIDIQQKYWPSKRKIFQSIMISRLHSDFINNVHNKSFEHLFKSIDQIWFPLQDITYIQFHFIWNAVFGSFLSFNSKHRANITHFIQQIFIDAGNDVALRYLGLQNILLSNNLFPTFAKFSAYIEQQLYEQLNYDETVWDLTSEKWNKHFQEIKDDKDSCVASKLLAAYRSDPDVNYSKNAILTELNVFFLAGVDTSVHSAEYAIILLAKYPEAQEKIYNELKVIFNADWKMEKVSFSRNVANLHYLRAFIHETLRISSIVPSGVPHYNSKSEIWLQNKKYRIPKDSVIISDIPSANRNDMYWIEKTNGNPMDLCMDIWLDNDKHFKFNLHKDKMCTFGVGPRECAGKAMAKKSLYLLFIKLILNYKFSVPPKSRNMEIKQEYEFTFVIKPSIGVHAEKRNYLL
eukprot:226762_1